MKREALVKSLAALFHDPPWKPWTVTGKLLRLTAMLEEDLKVNVRGSADESAHELQASMFVVYLAETIVSASLPGGLAADLAGALRQAAWMILERNSVIRDVDVTASSIDRHVLYSLLAEVGLEGKPYNAEVRIVNPFTLEKQIITSNKISEERELKKLIIEFIKVYARLLKEALEATCNNKELKGLGDEESREHCYTVLLTAAYLLLEPTWYYVTSHDGKVYIPPADTRVPTHTVFDHVNAALVMLNLLDDGCIAAVDLAGVQSWISESRRLRDLWAASWLASLLAWKAVEPLVWEYGPGVLLSPPGRLNPFLASTVLGPWIAKLKSGKNKWVLAALGLHIDTAWPADPVLPSRLLLAVPAKACEKLEDKVEEGIRSAWSKIMGMVVDYVHERCSGASIDAKLCPILNDDIREAVKRLEPPLGVRVVAERFEYQQGDQKGLLIMYIKTLKKLNEKEKIVKVSAPGRRSGVGYLELARAIYTITNGKIVRCTMCGKGIAVVDFRGGGKRLQALADLGREIGSEALCPYCLVKRLLRKTITRETSGDRSRNAKELLGVKPSKKVWRSVVEQSSRASAAWAILDSPASLPGLVEESLRELTSTKNKYSDFTTILYTIYFGLSNRGPMVDRAPRALIEHFDPDAANVLWTLIMHELDTPGSLRKLETSLRGTENKREIEVLTVVRKLAESLYRIVKTVPRRYAIVMADGDYMGKGLLAGKIPRVRVSKETPPKQGGLKPASAKDYLSEDKALLPPTEDWRDKVLPVYRKLGEMAVGALEKLAEDHTCREPEDPVEAGLPTVPVTLSYHMTVSRSLALVSALDRLASEEHDADIVYLGGDDALIIASPARYAPSGNGLRISSFPALRVAEALRGNWRGAGPSVGKDALRGEARSGFLYLKYNGRVLHVAAAPGAYGRSTVIYMADAKYPMWLSIGAARELEEAKDCSQTLGPEGEVWRKDLLVIASDTRGAGVAPLHLGEPAPNVEGEWRWWPYRWVEWLLRLSTAAPRGEEKLARRLLHDLPSTAGRLLAVAVQDGRHEAAASILTSLVGRGFSLGKEPEAIKVLLAGEAMKPLPRIHEEIMRIYADTAPMARRLKKDVDEPVDVLLMSLAPPALLEQSESIMAMRKGVRRMWEGRPAREVVARTFSYAIAVDRERLKVHGVDYTANAYLSLPSRGSRSSLPLPLAVFSLAYVYSGSIGLPGRWGGHPEG